MSICARIRMAVYKKQERTVAVVLVLVEAEKLSADAELRQLVLINQNS